LAIKVDSVFSVELPERL